MKRSADVSGNARHFCDCELNYTGYEGERSGLNHWTGVTQGTWHKACGLTSKGLSLCFSELNFTGCERSRSEMERWTGTPKGTRNESCGRFGKRSHFCDCELNYTGYEGERSGLNSTSQDVSIIYQLLFINKKTQYTL